MAYIASKSTSRDGGRVFYADSVDDIPFDVTDCFNVGDVFICRSDGASGIVTYMLFPAGWWKVG